MSSFVQAGTKNVILDHSDFGGLGWFDDEVVAVFDKLSHEAHTRDVIYS